MSKSQKTALTVFLVGAFVFLYLGAGILDRTPDWAVFGTTAGVSDVFWLLSAVVAAVGAALGINVREMVAGFVSPRNKGEEL